MMSAFARFLLYSLFIVLLIPGLSQAAREQRTALVIGNGAYSSSPLKNPVNDATDMATTLTRLGFSVTLKKDASLQEMVESIEEFGNNLKKGGVGLFYYAGHGAQVSGTNYLLPVGARINKESDVRFQAVDAARILVEMENANNSLNIIILDACRDNPFGKSFRSAARGLAIVTNAPAGTFISYSTGAGQVARDGEGRNSPYTSVLLRYMQEPGMPINDVFMNVRQQLRKETGQVPWELSSLEGKFYFNPGAVTQAATVAPAVDYAAEQRKINEEKERLKKERELLDQQEVLAEEKRRLEEKKKQVAARVQPSASTVKEIGRDGRFIAYANGTVLDTRTNLMWAAKDNGSDINWQGAKNYCENYSGGGYTDWRMPTKNELARLYDAGKTYQSECRALFVTLDIHLTELIRLTCYSVWTTETKGSWAASFHFWDAKWGWNQQSNDRNGRALPVRSVEDKPDEDDEGLKSNRDKISP
ncbi:MAG: caspase family protein [Smithellaceae bacterium]